MKRIPRRISSRDNPAVAALRAIADEPRRQGLALIDGIHLVSTALARGMVFRQVLLSDSGLQRAEVTTLTQRMAEVEQLNLSDGLFRQVTGVAAPAGIAAVIEIPPVAEEDPAGDAVLLDAIQDAGNVGTILRTAAAAGVRDVLLGPGCAGAWTARVLRAGQGAHFALRIREQVDLPAVVARGTVRAIATVAGGGFSLYDVDLRSPAVWLVGNEGAGLSAPLLALAGLRVTIPVAAEVESLNVAAATAICLFEARRQRMRQP